jgi:hypothetical protein
MKIGDTINTAIWLQGTEPPGMQAAYRAQVVDAIDELCDEKGFVHGPVRFEELPPNSDPRVPPVPDHIQGPDVRLLIAEADLTGPRLIEETRRFAGDLDTLDLERLRVITRRAHAAQFPGQFLTDMECDDIIEELGPESAMDAIRNAVDGRTIH